MADRTGEPQTWEELLKQWDWQEKNEPADLACTILGCHEQVVRMLKLERERMVRALRAKRFWSVIQDVVPYADAEAIVKGRHS